VFAIIKTGGKQYKVAANDRIAVMALPGEPGERVVFEDVLMLAPGEGLAIGAPALPGQRVAAEIIEQTRAPKVIAFKKRRRKNSKRKRGHRQALTLVRITEIGMAGNAG
jgi:large subunit ribosomal protein L21